MAAVEIASASESSNSFRRLIAGEVVAVVGGVVARGVGGGVRGVGVVAVVDGAEVLASVIWMVVGVALVVIGWVMGGNTVVVIETDVLDKDSSKLS